MCICTTYVRMFVYIHVCIYVRTYVCMYIYIYTYVGMLVRIRTGTVGTFVVVAVTLAG